MNVIFVVGATGTGKSKLALELAEKDGGVIFNCDSVQCYSEVAIGAAKPSSQDLGRVPHHLYSFVKPPSEITVGQYHREFFLELEKVRSTGVQTIYVVGGTGFYFQALEKGLFPVSQTPPELKADIETWLSSPEGLAEGYRELQKLDPEAAAKISSADAYRIGRAFELIRHEKKSLSQIQKDFAAQAVPFPYPLKKIGLNLSREELAPRISARTQTMLAGGLIEEVESLLKRGLDEWAPLKSVGYKEAVQFIRDNKSREWLVDEITLRTLQLAKKQKTWFKRDNEIEWLRPD